MADGPTNGYGPVPVIDQNILERVRQRLNPSNRFNRVELHPSYDPDTLIANYDLRYFPQNVNRATLEVRWYTNDDFTIQYTEHILDSDRWECRWGRHPNTHNSRSHFHPPPDAGTPGENADYPNDWRDVVTIVLGALDNHIKGFWE